VAVVLQASAPLLVVGVAVLASLGMVWALKEAVSPKPWARMLALLTGA
jgi:hypothetical protein